MDKIDKQVNLVQDYRKVFRSTSGKKVLYDLMKRCNMLDSSYSQDPNKVIYNEGRRSVVLNILSQIDTDPMALRKYMEDTIKEEEFFSPE